MSHQFKMIFALGLLLIFALACSFNFGESNNNQKPAAKTENVSANTTEKPEKNTTAEKKRQKKIESFQCKIDPMAYYLIPSGLSREELIEVAQTAHNAEPNETKLWLVDDDAKVKEHIAYFKQWCKGDADESLLPKDWEDKHVVGVTFPAGDGSWDLYEGNGKKKIANLKDKK